MSWCCSVCGATASSVRFRMPSVGTEGGVDADAFRPSADAYGHATANVLSCVRCGHGSVASPPEADAATAAYLHAVDEVSLREEEGQVATAARDLAAVEQVVEPGRVLDVGCWTGSFLVAAAERGWEPTGIEPSRWAAERARQRGVPVVEGELSSFRGDDASFRLVSLCDVLEHLADPGDALARVRELLEPAGAVFITVPDAGSRAARVLGRRWWSVLPMHLQYFTRSSLERLLNEHGFTVESARTHSKIFTVRYYAERFSGYSGVAGRLAVGAVERARVADRLVAVDLRDRMAVIATRSA